MAIVLSLETSSGVCSVALHEGGKLLSLGEIHQEQAHAAKLATLIDQVSNAAGITLDKIGAVAVSAGPGSYTGLRIGTSTAKGICYALSIPLLAVNTLDIMAAQMSAVNFGQHLLCPMIDARRMEVYCVLYDSQGNTILPVEAKVIDEFSFENELKKRSILFFGDGSSKCKAMLKSENALFADNVYPTAAQLGYLAAEQLARNEVVDLMSFEPFYLKEFRVKSPSGIISQVVVNKSE